jgi:hypothetical protein
LGCSKENSEVRARHPPAVRGRGERDREGEEEEAFFGDKDLDEGDVTLGIGSVGVEVRDIVGWGESLRKFGRRVCALERPRVLP